MMGSDCSICTSHREVYPLLIDTGLNQQSCRLPEPEFHCVNVEVREGIDPWIYGPGWPICAEIEIIWVDSADGGRDGYRPHVAGCPFYKEIDDTKGKHDSTSD